MRSYKKRSIYGIEAYDNNFNGINQFNNHAAVTAEAVAKKAYKNIGMGRWFGEEDDEKSVIEPFIFDKDKKVKYTFRNLFKEAFKKKSA